MIFGLIIGNLVFKVIPDRRITLPATGRDYPADGILPTLVMNTSPPGQGPAFANNSLQEITGGSNEWSAPVHFHRIPDLRQLT